MGLRDWELSSGCFVSLCECSRRHEKNEMTIHAVNVELRSLFFVLQSFLLNMATVVAKA